MRRWTYLALLDPHTEAVETDVGHRHRRKENGQDAVVATDGLVLLSASKTSMLLSSAEVKAWQEKGGRILRRASGGIVAIDMESDDRWCSFISCYAPPSKKDAGSAFFEAAGETRTMLKEGSVAVWMGDGNFMSAGFKTGYCALSTMTASAGRDVLQWLDSGSTEPCVVVSFLPKSLNMKGLPGPQEANKKIRESQSVAGRSSDGSHSEQDKLDVEGCR